MKLQTKAPHATNRGPAHGEFAAAVRTDADAAPAAPSLQGSGQVQSLVVVPAGLSTVRVLTPRKEACAVCWATLLPFRCCCCCCWDLANTQSCLELETQCNCFEFKSVLANARCGIISWYWWTRQTFTLAVRYDTKAL
jgi:hypothetical protein